MTTGGEWQYEESLPPEQRMLQQSTAFALSLDAKLRESLAAAEARIAALEARVHDLEQHHVPQYPPQQPDPRHFTDEGRPVLPFTRISDALDVARLYARAEEPEWVIDQMVRALTGSGRDEGEETAEYREFTETMEGER